MTQPVPPTDVTQPPEPVVVEELTPLEAAFYALVLAALARWLQSVLARVLQPWRLFRGAPIPSGVWALAPEWDREVRVLVEWLRVNAVPEGGDRWSGEADTDFDFPSNDAYTAAYLAQVRNWLVRIPEEVFNMVIADVVDGHNEGESFEEIAARIEDTLNLTGSENWPARARTIAVTECLPGDAVISSARFTAAYRRWYEGPWIEVETQGGNRFSGTPNHPVLTTRGWVGLGELNELDDLVCDDVQVQEPVVPLNPYVEAPPVTIAEVFDTLAAVLLPSRIGTGEPDFHGDGMDGYVDVLRPDRPLLLGNFSPVTKSRVEGVLEGPDVDHLVLTAASHRFPKDLGAGQLGRLTDGPDGHSGRLKDTPDGPVGGFVFSGEGLEGHSAPILFNDFMCRKGVTYWPDTLTEPGSLGPGPDDPQALQEPVDGITSVPQGLGDPPVVEATQVKLDRVVRIIRTDGFSGHVYNLTTLDGYFVSNGVYTGNTNGAANAGWYAAALETERQLGTQLWKEWDASHDTHVRPEHRAAGGQKRRIREPFLVGGEYLQVPGAKNGSAWNIINCRCAGRHTEAP